MDGSEEMRPWGKLSRLGGAEPELELVLKKKECTIGRRKGCDLSLPSNKLVSGDHCKIIVDEDSGQVLLEDTSTNGTVINKLKVVKRQTYPLQTGDVIYIVYRKNEPEHNIAYVYNTLIMDQPLLEKPIECNVESSCLVTKDTSGTGEGQVSLSLPVIPLPYEEVQPSTSVSEPTSATRPAYSVLGADCVAASGLSSDGELMNTSTETLSIPSEGAEVSSSVMSVGQTLEEDLEPKRKKTRRDEQSTSTPVSAPSTNKVLPEEVKPTNMKPDKMEETLTCIICQELLHDCVSLQPCMHTFCAACYSGWMERSSLCPTCRCPVERICKNHILNNLVEAYLLQHPDKCRSEEDIRSMDARNKITQDMLQPKVRRSFSDEEGSSEELLELSDVDSESSDIGQPYVMCRQCPGHRRPAVQSLFYTGSESSSGVCIQGDVPSTSSDVPAGIQEYTCPSHWSHVMCTCCFQPMPDRRAERERCPQIPPQQCTVCFQFFCHMYWGCTGMGCIGCLASFCELNLGEKCLDGVVNENHYESDILKNYLASRGLTWKDMLNESLLALQRGVFMLSDYRISGSTVLCYCCGLRSFRELTYQYRQNIPPSELPAAVTSRPNCYWGRNCRTQIKAHHAMKFNHICEQTRFKN
uniref:E3 ubiquitin-protein ligase CHFR n=1 Tax=Geotrypetes seraphini TaxID=260995 RepID=A0A6P8S1E2_GEOSA|nr:E3 ubiquitin-protein ligase CHFR [Geotrypetes seraphini]XP_033810816.1 E3 ubiquitin-protein ligase CHFR [Geotrypetes seraphini]